MDRHRDQSKTEGANLRPDCTILPCDSIDEWLRPESYNYQGLLLRRSISPTYWTPAVHSCVEDWRAKMPFPELEFGRAVYVNEVQKLGGSLRKAAAAASQQNLDTLGLPASLVGIINDDAGWLAEVMSQLLPNVHLILVKIEAIGKFGSCCRWHQDDYLARAIVSYNGTATSYTPSDNVDLSKNVVFDELRATSASTGDLLLIKGLRFPHSINGLVHKAPENAYHPNGEIVDRLVLKVDMFDTGQRIQSCGSCHNTT